MRSDIGKREIKILVDFRQLGITSIQCFTPRIHGCPISFHSWNPDAKYRSLLMDSIKFYSFFIVSKAKCQNIFRLFRTCVKLTIQGQSEKNVKLHFFVFFVYRKYLESGNHKNFRFWVLCLMKWKIQKSHATIHLTMQRKTGTQLINKGTIGNVSMPASCWIHFVINSTWFSPLVHFLSFFTYIRTYIEL